MIYKLSKNKVVLIVIFLILMVCTLIFVSLNKSKAPSRVLVTFPQYKSGSLEWLIDVSTEFSPKREEPYSVIKNIPEDQYNSYIIRNLGLPNKEDLYYVINGRQLGINIKNNNVKPLEHNKELNNIFKSISLDNGAYYYQPITWYNWGIYYSEELFLSLGIESFPDDWDSFIEMCQTLKKNGINPIYIPKHELWAGTIWFEYLNIRLNGIEFHRKLLNSEESWEDKRVLDTFSKLRELQPFMAEVDSRSTWETSAEEINNNVSGISLMGRFFYTYWKTKYPKSISWASFPNINKDKFKSEIVSSAGFVLNSKSANTKESNKFLKYLSNDKVNDRIQSSSTSLPVANNSWWNLQTGIDKEMWNNINSAKQLQPVMDRYANPKIILKLKVAIKELLFTDKNVEEIVNPLNTILEE